MSRKFVLDGQYDALFCAHGIYVDEVLRKAGLPEDLFSRKRPSVTSEEYFRFMESVGALADDPELAVRIATSDHIETFSPPVFAAYCSRDGSTCIRRLGEYKGLVGPVRYLLRDMEGGGLSVGIAAPDGGAVPRFLAEVEMAFLVHILRSATKEAVSPVWACLRMNGDTKTADSGDEKEETGTPLAEYLGCGVVRGGEDAVVFSGRDLRLPFISHNEAMWDYFEPEMARRLYELDRDDPFAARVRSALGELLPGGDGNTDSVAEKLGVSRRTLQRRLAEEGTTFREQLERSRQTLAEHYLRNTDIPTDGIAYLLGFKEQNSFLRFFKNRTGMSASAYRKSAKNEANDSTV